LPRFATVPVFYAITVVVLVLWVVASQPDFPEVPAAVVAVAVSLGLLVGLVWIICFALTASETRLRMPAGAWARWLCIPAMALLTWALVQSDLPVTARFEVSRGQLEQAAARAETGAQVEAGWVGLIHVQAVRVTNGTTVFVLFGDEREVSGGCGLAYADGRDPGLSAWAIQPWLVEDYGHGWRYWCNDVPPM
jgi:hypothetical protein